MKVLHRLKNRVNHLTDFYVFDVETGTVDNSGGIQWQLNARPESFRFGVLYGHNYSKTIYSVDEFKQTLNESRFKGKKVFAHNAFYDLTTLYGNIFDLDNRAIFIGSRFISATNGNCIFCDSLNIVKTSVKELGKMIGVEKPDLGNDEMYSKNGIDADVINRCYTDCVIVWRVLFDIFTFAGNIKITQAGLSMNYYRAFHQPYNIEYNDLTKEFWKSYFGGRTEAFKIGKTYSSVIDVNSMYPYIMSTIRFPNPRYLRSIVPSAAEFESILNSSDEGLVYAIVNHKKYWMGLLPVKKNGKLIFPTGRLIGHWNLNELRFALSTGLVTIEKIKRVIAAPSMPSPFESFVDTLYKKRFESKLPFEIYRVKILMNSLYGKFGQKMKEETVYIKDIDRQMDEIRQYEKDGRLIEIVGFNAHRNDAFLILKKDKHLEPSYCIPSFASYVTSGARVLLAKKLIELEKHRPVYCDTDSIFFEVNTGFENEFQLGGWKLEDKIVTEIRGLKNYTYIDQKKNKTVSRIKGVPLSAKQVAPNTFEYSNLVLTKEALRRGIEPGVLTKRTKIVTGVYDKRTIFSNGETEPINIK